MIEHVDVVWEYLLFADDLFDLLLGKLFGVTDIAWTEYVDKLGIKFIPQFLEIIFFIDISRQTPAYTDVEWNAAKGKLMQEKLNQLWSGFGVHMYDDGDPICYFLSRVPIECWDYDIQCLTVLRVFMQV